MINILAICPNPHDGTSYYRALGVLQTREMRKHFNVFKLYKELLWEHEKMSDIIFFQRPFTSGNVQSIEYSKDCKRKVWVDYDDDLLSVPTNNQVHGIYSTQEAKENILKCISMADLVTVSTKKLKEKFDKINKNIHVVPNAFDDDLFTLEYAKEQNKSILWRGTNSHQMDLMTYRDDILDKCKNSDYHWWFFGCQRHEIWFMSEFTGQNSTYVGPMDVVYYMKKLKSIKASIAIVPLQNNEFNKSKSNIAYIEMVYAGAVPIVPRWEEWELPGCFKYSEDASTFSTMLEFAMGNQQLLKQYNKEAVDYIRENLLLSNINKKRIELLEGIL
jgi:galactitol-specific phosphotransferase system IIB component